MNLLPQFFYGMVVIGSLSMVSDGAGVRGVGRALGGRWEGVGLASGEGRAAWESDLYPLHCSGYLLVFHNLCSQVYLPI